MKTLDDLKEQIQDDLICRMDSSHPLHCGDLYEEADDLMDDLCQIVVDRINEFKRRTTLLTPIVCDSLSGLTLTFPVLGV